MKTKPSNQSYDENIQKIQAQARMWAHSGKAFVSSEFLQNLEHITSSEMDLQEVGIIELDDEGNILHYNSTESYLTGISQKEAKGKNFFVDIAPCTNNILFRGTFSEGIRKNELNYLFPYVFTYKMKPVYVKIHLFRTLSKRNFVIIKREESIVF